MVTNAHPDALAVKKARTGLEREGDVLEHGAARVVGERDVAEALQRQVSRMPSPFGRPEAIFETRTRRFKKRRAYRRGVVSRNIAGEYKTTRACSSKTKS